eukprot:CAMPEP_0184689898 /NCGR_PEP_ID=MMETSP0312-20130426/30912_1 /TAXON_ID=31354 /ORGANISM="Compsopogon coeruleus, Strain SAG 36.94" /LENGTH=108 /DNA_ID=CAMNT_0027147303 /DNA_START=96 /DNA_END=422 /DNA_ORIENTATION=+
MVLDNGPFLATSPRYPPRGTRIPNVTRLRVSALSLTVTVGNVISCSGRHDETVWPGRVWDDEPFSRSLTIKVEMGRVHGWTPHAHGFGPRSSSGDTDGVRPGSQGSAW